MSSRCSRTEPHLQLSCRVLGALAGIGGAGQLAASVPLLTPGNGLQGLTPASGTTGLSLWKGGTCGPRVPKLCVPGSHGKTELWGGLCWSLLTALPLSLQMFPLPVANGKGRPASLAGTQFTGSGETWVSCGHWRGGWGGSAAGQHGAGHRPVGTGLRVQEHLRCQMPSLSPPDQGLARGQWSTLWTAQYPPSHPSQGAVGWFVLRTRAGPTQGWSGLSHAFHPQTPPLALPAQRRPTQCPPDCQGRGFSPGPSTWVAALLDPKNPRQARAVGHPDEWLAWQWAGWTGYGAQPVLD